MKFVLRNANGLVEGVAYSIDRLADLVGVRPVYRIDIYPSIDEESCQLGISLEDGASAISSVDEPASVVKVLLKRFGHKWPDPIYHERVS